MRLPVSWTVLMDDEGNINKDFMDRIDEVVGWILDSGMCCILNSHHDGWSEKFAEDYEALHGNVGADRREIPKIRRKPDA